MSLSGILYTDALGVTSDITQSAWETPLIFTPWYSSLLSVNGDIIVGSGVEFSGALTHASVEVEPTATALYHIQIGPDNLLASFKSFQ